MRSSARSLGAVLAIAAATVLPPAPAFAEIVNFSYSGGQTICLAGLCPAAVDAASGTGSFSFAAGLGTVALADVTGFSLSLTDTVTLADALNLLGLPPLVTRFTYGLSDLAALFATIGADGVPTDLALATDAIFGSDLTFGGASSTPEDLQVSSLAPGDAMTTDGAGLAGLAGLAWRRRRAG